MPVCSANCLMAGTAISTRRGSLLVPVEVDLDAAEAPGLEFDGPDGAHFPGSHPGVFPAEVQGGVDPVQVPERPHRLDRGEYGVVLPCLGAEEDGELGPGVLPCYLPEFLQIGVGVHPGERDDFQHFLGLLSLRLLSPWALIVFRSAPSASVCSAGSSSCPASHTSPPGCPSVRCRWSCISGTGTVPSWPIPSSLHTEVPCNSTLMPRVSPSPVVPFGDWFAPVFSGIPMYWGGFTRPVLHRPWIRGCG